MRILAPPPCAHLIGGYVDGRGSMGSTEATSAGIGIRHSEKYNGPRYDPDGQSFCEEVPLKE